MGTRNPWLKLKEEAQSIRTPTRVLRDQAGLLGDATGGVIRGQVDIQEGGINPLTTVEFSALVPTLNNYEIVLFRVRHPVTQYPATLLPEWGGGPVQCDNEAALETAVIDYCASPDLQKIVTGLFAQAEQTQ